MRIVSATLLLVSLFCYRVSYSQINISVPKTDNPTSLPLKTQQEIDAVKLPGNGYTVFNTTTNCINYYLNGKWFELCGSCLPKPQPVTVDSIVQMNQSLKIFLHQEPVDSVQVYYKDQNISYRVKERTITTPLPLMPGNSEIHLQVLSFNACGKEPLTVNNNYTAKIKSLHVSAVYEVTVDKIKYRVRDIGNYTWMVDDYVASVPAKNIPADLQKRHFYSIGLNDHVCPAGWDLPDTIQWQGYLQLFGDSVSQVILNPKADNMAIGLRTEGFYAIAEKQHYLENVAATYWAKNIIDGQRSLVLINTNAFAMRQEKPELIAAKIRCIKAK